MVFTTKSQQELSSKEQHKLELKRAKALHKQSENKEFASRSNFQARDVNNLLNQTRNYRNKVTPVRELLFRGCAKIV